MVQRHFDEIRSYPRISDMESQFKSNLQTYLTNTWMKHGREAAQTFPADGSNDIALGGTPAAKNDGGMGRSGGEERARFERNVTHTLVRKEAL